MCSRSGVVGYLVSPRASDWPALAVRSSSSRRYERRRSQETWWTFDPESRRHASDSSVFDNLAEGRWGPEATAYRPGPETGVQVVTYVRAGRLTRKGANGHVWTLHAGEFERTFAEPGDRDMEANPSRTHIAHVFRISLHGPQVPIDRRYARKRFAEADRKAMLVLVASGDGRSGSLSLGQDASIYSGLLYPGQHVTHELAAGRTAWLHVVSGSASVGELALMQGDGVRVASPTVSVTAREHTEVLMVEIEER